MKIGGLRPYVLRSCLRAEMSKALFSVTFPIVDLRSFIDGADHRLPIPDWPAPLPGVEFVRSFGPIQHRRRGGVQGWIGESTICKANKAIRFKNNLVCALNSGVPRSFWSRRHGKEKAIAVAFRRFYFDGLAAGKFEIGFTCELHRRERLNANNAITSILRSEIKVRSVVKSDYRTLEQSGAFIAQAYRAASTSHTFESHDHHLVHAMTPAIIVQWEGSALEIPKRSGRIGVGKSTNFAVFHWYQKTEGHTYYIPVWGIRYNNAKGERDARSVRLNISRLHASTESILYLLNAIRKSQITVTSKSEASDNLQRCLDTAIATFGKSGLNVAKSLDRESALDVPNTFESYYHWSDPGRVPDIMARIRSFNFRPALSRKIAELMEGKVFFHVDKMELDMSDKIEVYSQGHAQVLSKTKARDVTQITRNGETATEISRLLDAMELKAETPEQKADVGIVRMAAQAVQDDDILTAKSLVSRAGFWVAEVAKDVSAKVIEGWISGGA